MPGKHKNPTIAFRPNEWEKVLIDKRAELSGMNKKDFIARSCIYSNIVYVGTMENILKVIDEMIELEEVMKEIAGQIMSCNLSVTDNAFMEMKEEFLALALTIVDIVNGADYLLESQNPKSNDRKKECINRTQDC